MQRTPFLLALTTAIILLQSPAWSDTETKTYKMSVTIPEMVQSVQNNIPSRSVQEQRMVRNDQSVLVRSIVLP